MSEDYRIITRLWFVMLAAAALGAAFGALYYVNRFTKGDDIINYLDSFIASLHNGMDNGSIVWRSVKNSMLIVGIFSICTFFRLGVIPITITVIRQGFVCGFANAVFIGTYGYRGLMLTAARLPENILYFSALLIGGAAASAAAVLKPEKDKKFFKKLLIFLIFCGSTFCASAAAQGFLTTTFMKMLF